MDGRPGLEESPSAAVVFEIEADHKPAFASERACRFLCGLRLQCIKRGGGSAYSAWTGMQHTIRRLLPLELSYCRDWASRSAGARKAALPLARAIGRANAHSKPVSHRRSSCASNRRCARDLGGMRLWSPETFNLPGIIFHGAISHRVRLLSRGSRPGQLTT